MSSTDLFHLHQLLLDISDNDENIKSLSNRYMKLLGEVGINDFINTKYNTVETLTLRKKVHLYANEDYVIKCYPNMQYEQSCEISEFTLLKLLYDSKCEVPELIEKFETTYYRCYVMRRVGESFAALLVKNPHGFGDEMAKKVARSLISSIQKIHEAGKYYRDFSVGNVTLHDNKVYMIDLGSTTDISSDYCSRYTTRYASRGMVAKRDYTLFDEYESLGYVLLDISKGILCIPRDYSYKAKCRIYSKCLTTRGFIGEYFRSIENGSLDMLHKSLN